MEKEQLIELLEEIATEIQKSIKKDDPKTEGELLCKYYDKGKLHAIRRIAFLLKMDMNQEEARRYLQDALN